MRMILEPTYYLFSSSKHAEKAFMKNSIIVLALLVAIAAKAQTGAAASGPAAALPKPTPFSIVERGENHQVWERTVYESGPNGTVVARKHRYTELASGLNFRNPTTRQWAPSKEEIDILPQGGAAAINGQHQVYFPGDIYAGTITLVTPDGKQLKSRPLALSLDDGNNTVLIGVLTNSVGVLVGSNQVIFPNAFAGIHADLRYTYTKAGLEQDVILRQQPPSSVDCGLDPAATRLQVLTEFFNPPQPATTTSPLPAQAGVRLDDQTMVFGRMQMILGRAFLIGDSAKDAGAWVGKRWLLLNGRQFLLEEVPVKALTKQLATLPLFSVNDRVGAPNLVASRDRQLPAQHLAVTDAKKPVVLMARATMPADGLVLDYQTVSGTTSNMVFQADTTYYVSGSTYLNGTNTFEGGTVIKSAYGVILEANNNSTVNWLASPYRPVVFTAVDDNSVGETISGSTGNPTYYYARVALLFGTGVSRPAISNFRVSYAITGFYVNDGDLTLSDGQFVNCSQGVDLLGSGNTHLKNVLFSTVEDCFLFVYSTTVDLQNVTFNNITSDITYDGSCQYFYMTNCILSRVYALTSYGPTPQGDHNGFYRSPPFGTSRFTNSVSPFQAVGAGYYYLTNGCAFRGVGTSNIDTTLRADLARKTTYPPIVYSLVIFSNNTALSPQAQRDTNATPDLGYHYDPLDYALGFDAVTGATLTINPGTAIATFGVPYTGGVGLVLYGSSPVLVSQGLANNLNRIVEYNTVQEQAPTNWTPTFYGSVYDEENLNNGGTMPGGINCYFTDWSVLAQNIPQLYLTSGGPVNFQNCQFHGGELQSYYNTVNLTNCLLERVNVDLEPCDNNVPSVRNNLIWGGTFGFYTTVTNAVIKDNLFDHAAIPDWIGGIGNTYDGGNNAYVTNCDELDPSYTSDVVLSNSPAYQTGTLGHYYLPSNSPLINAGDVTADQVGLYHFTTQTNQVPETNSVVDIGYHYVATDAYGNPLDTNGDGIPDYLEDANGNGIFDAGDLGDWLVSPYNGLSRANGLQVFTPLK